MAQLLPSDLNNPEFAGAKNPDGALIVKFLTIPIKNEFKSAEENRPIYEDIDHIEITVPGDVLNTIVQPVREDHKERFPQHWAHFQNKHAGDAREIGTPLSHWPKLGLSQVEELRALKFFTVESVATASDQRIMNVGMLAGMSPYAFREAAQRYLRVALDNAALQKAEDHAKATEAKLAEEKAAREAMEAKMAEMAATLADLQKPPRTKRKYTKRDKVANV